MYLFYILFFSIIQVVRQIVKQMSSNLSWQFTINIYNKIYSFTILIQEITNYEKRVSAYL